MGKSLEEAAVNVCCLVLLVQAMGLKLGYPNVEELMALCLGKTRKVISRFNMTMNLLEK